MSRIRPIPNAHSEYTMALLLSTCDQSSLALSSLRIIGRICNRLKICISPIGTSIFTANSISTGQRISASPICNISRMMAASGNELYFSTRLNVITLK